MNRDVYQIPVGSNEQQPRLQRVLIVLLGSLGDVLRGLSVAHALKQSGRFHISWLVERKSRALVDMCSDVDAVIEFQRAQGVRGFWKAWQELRAQKFDICLDLQRHAKSGLLSRLSGAKRRIGFSPQNTKECNHLFNTEYISPWNTEQIVLGPNANESAVSPEGIAPEELWRSTKLAAYLSFLPKVGCAVPAQPGWRFKIEDKELGSGARRQDVDPKSVGVILGSSWPSKDWPGTAALVRALVARKDIGRIVLFGDRSTAEQGEALEKLAPERVQNTSGKLPLSALLVELSKRSVVVGPDSGPGHMCGALGVPYIGLFGPTSVHLTAPFGLAAALIGDVGCAPCYKRVCPGLGGICMRLISPERVLKQIDIVLGFAQTNKRRF